jgi:phospholipid-translocating ATPase
MVSPDPEETQGNKVSIPNKRIRWATRRVSGKTANKKRESLVTRLAHKRSASNEKKAAAAAKRVSAAGTAETEPSILKPDGSSLQEPERQSTESETTAGEAGRRVFFNIPLPDDARDEDGSPSASFARNKIRTAKYTPISFIPKNLWFQFHNIANVYFLFIIILGVSSRNP